MIDRRILRGLPLTLSLLLILANAAEAGKKQKNNKDEPDGKETKWDVSHPPGEWKSIVIDTEETTWTHLDVSPDGRTIVFDMLGDLYTVPIEGGDATAFTHGIEWDFQPRYSPDGSKIAFISDRAGGDNLWVINADGSEPRAITEEKEHLVHNPSWSPDGEYLVAKKGFTSTRSIPAGEIWMFHVGGGDGLPLIERPDGERGQKNIAEPAFSTDGRYVYFSQDTTAGRVWQYGKDSTGQIFVIKRLDRETGDVQLFAGGPGGAIRPTPSPDGRYLAYVKRMPGLTSAIYLKDLKSGKERPVFDRFERDLQETNGSHGNTTAFAWTPESSSIVFWSAGKIRRVEIDSGESSVIPVHVRVEKKVQQALRLPVPVSPDEFTVRMLRWVQLSPDGKRVLFQALGHLYVRDVAGGEPRRLTSQNEHWEFWPSYSPDGKHVVYTSWSDGELGALRMVSAMGGVGNVLTPEPGHYVEPRFSPDGERIVYRKIGGGYLLSPLWSMEPGLYVLRVGGGEPLRIPEAGSAPQFSPDGKRVLFSAQGEDGERELRSVALDGRDERTHLQGAKVTEFNVSPDGRWVAFTEQFNAYVAPFMQTGKTVSLGSSTTSIPVRQISKRSGEHLRWSQDSRSLHWAHGPVLYTRELTDAFGFLDGSPDELPEPVESGLDLSFTRPSDRPVGRIAIVGARIVTMRDAWNTREVIENGTIVVNGHRIETIGSSDAIDVPANAYRLDASGMTVIPGLFDAHSHGAMARNEITPRQNWIQYANLAFGVTTIHDPSNDTSSIFAVAELQKAGMTLAPRTFSTGTILYGAHVPGATAEIESLDDARFHVQRLKDTGAISVKSYQQPRRDQRQQIVAAGHELGVMVVPEGGMKFQHNMTEIVDGHTTIEHSLSIKTAYDDVLQLWSHNPVGYTPTFVVSFGGLEGERYWYQHTEVWKNERLLKFVPRFVVEPRSMRRTMAPNEHYNHIWVARTARQLMDRGVSVHIGAHGQLAGLAAHWEMWMMEQGGFTPWQALRGATYGGASHFGMDAEIGSLEPGKLADLVVIDGNPLENLRRSEQVAYVMQNGRLFDASTMNQIGNETSERQPFFFEIEGGDTIGVTGAAWLESWQRRHGCRH